MSIIRPRDIRNVVGISASTVRRLEQAGEFPARVKLSKHGNATGWHAHEVEAWLEGRERGPGPTPTAALESRWKKVEGKRRRSGART